MNKLFSKVAALSVGLAMAIGVGVAVGSNSAKEVRADEPDTSKYQKITAVSGLAAGDKAVLYNPTDNEGVTGTSGTKDASAAATGWLEYVVVKTSTGFNLQAGENSYVTLGTKSFSHSSTATNLSVTSNGYLCTVSNSDNILYRQGTFIRTYTSKSSDSNYHPFAVYKVLTSDVLKSITVSGTMTKTEYTTAESWSAVGLTATGTYETAGQVNITDKVTWSFNPATPAVSVTSVVATATLGTVSGSSSAQAVTVTEAPADPGTEDNPYTVAQARAAIDAASGTSNVYATGIVSKIVTAYSSGYQNVTFNFSTDGTTSSDQLQAFREKSTYSSTVKVGDTVVVYGSLTKYSSTYEFGANCKITSLTPAPEPETVTTIKDIYTSTIGSPVEIDGYFVGAVSDGIYLMNGEYGIFVYRGTAPDGAVVNETKLHVAGTSTTFNNLYQIAQGATITVNASAEVATPINYTLTGSESTADLSVASRRVVEKGAISKITRDGTDYTSSYEGEVPTVDTSKDIFLTINGVQVIYKKSDVTQTVFEVLFGYLLNGKNVNVESFTGFYKTEFQLRFSSVVEATAGYTAEKFAQDLLDKTDVVCKGYDGVKDNKEALASVWLALQENVLSDEEIERFNDKNNDFDAARARYDYLVGKYGLTDFLGRNPTPIPGGAYYKDGITDNNNTMIIVISIAAVSALAFTMLLVFKKKKQK